LGGYQSARNSFCDDVTLARYAAAQGAKVGFLDGCKLLKVRMYDGAAETWREWGRSLDLKDACSPAQKWGDLAFLVLTQALPLFVIALTSGAIATGLSSLPVLTAFVVNLSLLIIRFALLLAISPAYDLAQSSGAWSFWLSPLADPLAVLRIFLSSIRVPTQWRGRIYT
jgi:dolichol-phosphate mannosyltransferase